MKLFFFGEYKDGADFAVVPAETKEEAVEKLKVAKEAELEKIYGIRPFYKDWDEKKRPLYGIESGPCHEIEGGVFFWNMD